MTPKHTGQWRDRPCERPNLVIIGAGEFAEIAFEYFTHDSPYNVVAFAAEREHLRARELCGLPVLPFDELEQRFPAANHSAFVAITYTKLNRVRARLFAAARAKGYAPASYVSSRAFVWHNASIGENVFVFENNVVQHRVSIGDDVILWSGNHIGHQSRIEDHCYLSSQVVVSGYCCVGAHSFLGVNATLADHVRVGASNLIGAGAIILKDTPDHAIYQAGATEPSPVSSLRFFRIKEPV